MLFTLKAYRVKVHTKQSVTLACKVIKDSIGFWFPHCGFQISDTVFCIPDSRFQIFFLVSETWIPDSIICRIQIP